MCPCIRSIKCCEPVTCVLSFCCHCYEQLASSLRLNQFVFVCRVRQSGVHLANLGSGAEAPIVHSTCKVILLYEFNLQLAMWQNTMSVSFLTQCKLQSNCTALGPLPDVSAHHWSCGSTVCNLTFWHSRKALVRTHDTHLRGRRYAYLLAAAL